MVWTVPKLSSVSFQWSWVGGTLGLACCNWDVVVAFSGTVSQILTFLGAIPSTQELPGWILGKGGLLHWPCSVGLCQQGTMGNGNQPEISSEVQILKDLVNSSLVSSRTRKEFFWFGFPGLVCFFTQGKKIQGLSVVCLRRLAGGQEMLLVL